MSQEFEYRCRCGHPMIHQSRWGVGNLFLCTDVVNCVRLLIVVPETGSETWYSREESPSFKLPIAPRGITRGALALD